MNKLQLFGLYANIGPICQLLRCQDNAARRHGPHVCAVTTRACAVASRVCAVTSRVRAVEPRVCRKGTTIIDFTKKKNGSLAVLLQFFLFSYAFGAFCTSPEHIFPFPSPHCTARPPHLPPAPNKTVTPNETAPTPAVSAHGERTRAAISRRFALECHESCISLSSVEIFHSTMLMHTYSNNQVFRITKLTISIVDARKIGKLLPYAEWVTALCVLLIGGFVYLLFRPQNLLMFRVLDEIGGMPYIDFLRIHTNTLHLSGFVVNSLPAGLWTTSYLMMMHLSTKELSKKVRLMLALPLPLTAVILEFMQLFGWCTGTFDFYDLICYLVPLAVFIKLTQK